MGREEKANTMVRPTDFHSLCMDMTLCPAGQSERAPCFTSALHRLRAEKKMGLNLMVHILPFWACVGHVCLTRVIDVFYSEKKIFDLEKSTKLAWLYVCMQRKSFLYKSRNSTGKKKFANPNFHWHYTNILLLKKVWMGMLIRWTGTLVRIWAVF